MQAVKMFLATPLNDIWLKFGQCFMCMYVHMNEDTEKQPTKVTKQAQISEITHLWEGDAFVRSETHKKTREERKQDTNVLFFIQLYNIYEKNLTLTFVYFAVIVSKEQCSLSCRVHITGIKAELPRFLSSLITSRMAQGCSD